MKDYTKQIEQMMRELAQCEDMPNEEWEELMCEKREEMREQVKILNWKFNENPAPIDEQIQDYKKFVSELKFVEFIEPLRN